jgi:hypothetical protein
MNSFKKSLITLAGLPLLVGVFAVMLPLVGRGQGNSPNVTPQLVPRKFYLTRTEHTGSEALSACAAGYHMASLWEIHDPTYLRYDSALGYTKADTGSGPPAGAGAHGWVRTGGSDHNGPFPGSGNCLAWTSTAGSGTVVSLSDLWNNPELSKIDPWTPNVGSCSVDERVWCVQD